MSEKLILRMSHQTASPISWLVWSDSSRDVIAAGELNSQAELPSLAKYAQGRAVTVLVNSADVRLYRHYMATKPSRQMLKAIPYMLEDELAEDIDSLHFAIEETGFDKERGEFYVNLAIVNRNMMESWLSVLTEAGIQVRKVLPEVLCLPQFSGDKLGVSGIDMGQGWLLREGYWQGCFLEQDWLSLYFQQYHQKLQVDVEEEQTDETEQTVVFQHYSELSESLQTQLSGLDSIELDAGQPELAMLLLAQQADEIKWNLLQGDLAPKKAINKTWQMWKPAAVLAVFVLLVQFVTMFLNWQQSEQQLAEAKAALTQEYQKAFPKEKVRINLLRRQLTRKVAEATGGAVSSGEDGFLSTLNKLQPVFQQFKDVQSDSIRFDGKRKELRLNASAASFQQFELFKSAIENLGLEVQQGALSNEGQRVTGSLNIKEAS